jgi:pimeloyl-ACP methyl ester carboxylesterase
VTGERDEKFTALGAELVDSAPNFEHVVIPDCGHRILIEKPDELAEVIRDFQNRRL